jgi:long-chain acyl-CoA synthetase
MSTVPEEQAYLQNLQQLWADQWPQSTPAMPVYPIGERPISEYLSHWASEQPNKAAVHFYGYSLSYAELDRLSNQFAHWLSEKGIQAGDPVAVFMPNCPQFIIAFYGILKAGAVYHPISPLSKEMELRHQLTDCLPKAAICFDALLPLLQPLCEELLIEHVMATSLSEIKSAAPTLPIPDLMELEKLPLPVGITDFYPALAAQPTSAPEHQIALDDIAAVNYTGGTTGLPKGCIHTHRHMVYTCASFMPAVSSSDSFDQISLAFLPQFWIAGENSSLLCPIFSGSTQVLLARWDCETFMAAVQHYRVEFTTLLVDSVDEVLNHSALASYDLSSLELTPCVSFIKKLTRDYRRRWFQLTGCQLFESSYGMTETNTCDTFTAGFQVDDFDLSFDPSFVGLPVSGTEFKVCDFDSGALLPLEQEGELCVRSPALFSGYWNKDSDGGELFPDGWFHTGDLGLITEQGFIRYLGRRKEMIKVNGMSVFPTELETMLGQHSAIAASAVIARDDEKSGQKPVAFVVLRPNHQQDAESLSRWCKDTMAIYKVPEFRLLDALPMTATGKVKKKDLEPLI